MQTARYLLTLLACAAFFISAGSASAQSGVTAMRVDLETKLASGGERVKGTVAIKRDPAATAQDVTILLETDSPALVRFRTTTLVIPARDSQAVFDFDTTSTQIQTQVRIRGILASLSSIRAEFDLTLIPARINKVTLSATSMFGTLGSSIMATAELKAPAPAGGIQLYLSSFQASPTFKPKSTAPTLPDPFVPAGSRTVSFTLNYVDVLRTYSSPHMNSVSFDPAFETQQRTFTLGLGLDPYGKTIPTSIPGRSVLLSFTVIPLRINTISVQPSTITAGAEALGTFVLNAPAGPNERFGSDTGSFSAARIVPVGTSCLVSSSTLLVFEMTAGSLTQNFKVCGKTVSSATQTTANVTLRSGTFTAPFTVQP